jgi:hypothetical protein
MSKAGRSVVAALEQENAELSRHLAALMPLLVRADSICSLVAARESGVTDESREELWAVSAACRAVTG